MFFSIALIAWIGGSLASIVNGNRRLPSVVLLFGLVFVVLTFMEGAGYFDVVDIAILAAIIWIANDVEIKNAERTITTLHRVLRLGTCRHAMFCLPTAWKIILCSIVFIATAISLPHLSVWPVSYSTMP